jgi:hypothetical protein
MLCVNSYTKEYIKECRSKMESQLAAYKALVTATRETDKPARNSAVDSLNRFSSTNWPWFWTASLFIEVGQPSKRMAIL